MACKWINGQYSLGHKYRGQTGQVQKTLHPCWKSKIANPVSKIDDIVKHVFREHNQETDHWANLGAEGQRPIVLDRRDNSESWKSVKGFLGMAAPKTIVKVDAPWGSKGSTGDRWVTISRIAVLLNVGTAMAAEVAGVCVLTGVFGLSFQQKLMCSEFNQCIERILNKQ